MTITAQSPKGEFRQVSIDPLSLLPGDQVQQVGNQIIVIRGGQVVATRDLTSESSVVPLEVTEAQTVSSAIFFRSRPVPGQSQVLNDVQRNTETGEITFVFADGNSIIYPSWEIAKQELAVLDSSPEFAQKILMYKAIVNSPDGTNMTTMNGVNCSVNFNASVPIALIEL